MQVVDLGGYRARDTIAVLQHLLEQARRGEISGMAVCVELTGGKEDVLLTDSYRRNQFKAANAGGRIFWRSQQGQDEQEAKRY